MPGPPAGSGLPRRRPTGVGITVIYRSRPAFQIVPAEDGGEPGTPLEDDPLFRAEAVGRSRDGRSSGRLRLRALRVVRALFVDNAGWMACADGADPAHGRARAARDALTLIRLRLGIRAAEAWCSQVDGSPRVRHEAIDALRAEKGRALFFRRRDKDDSFTDCTSFVVTRELKLKEALRTDRNFRQMGFLVLP